MKFVECPDCKGSGIAKYFTYNNPNICPLCNGRGDMSEQHFDVWLQVNGKSKKDIIPKRKREGNS